VRALVFVMLAACTRPSAERALADLEVGSATLGGTNVTITDGMAAIRRLTDNNLELWASAPVIEVTIFTDVAAAWTILVSNTPVDAVLTAGDMIVTARPLRGAAIVTARPLRGAAIVREPGTRPTVARFTVPLVAGANRLLVAPPDHDVPGAFRVAAMADIQTAMGSVHEVFEAISAVPDLRFVVAMGDITDRAEIAEYELFEQKLLSLDIPFYSTIGNHELWADPERWFTRYGRMNFQFTFKGAAFTFVDSGDAGIDPVVEDWLDGWIADAGAKPHVFLTHMPPIDPVAYRYGGFRSMRDGHRLLARLAQGGVDLTLYGHIHTHIEFENAGIPARISGGGGADPMRLDGIDRHFLVLDVDDRAIQDVRVQRVD
jgi:Icc protein